MNKGKTYIDIILTQPGCGMISPGYVYPRTKDDMPIIGAKKKERNPDNLQKLETMVSTVMQEHYTKRLAEALKDTVPILHIDCGKRGDDDIMIHIFKEYIKQSKAEDKLELVCKAIGENSIATGGKRLWSEYIHNEHPTMEEIRKSYHAFLLDAMIPGNPGHKKMMLDFESDIAYNGMEQLMRSEGQRYLCLYLDQPQSLTEEEQQRINTILYTR